MVIAFLLISWALFFLRLPVFVCRRNDSIYCWHLLPVWEPVDHGQVVGFYFLMDKQNSQGAAEVFALWFLSLGALQGGKPANFLGLNSQKGTEAHQGWEMGLLAQWCKDSGCFLHQLRTWMGFFSLSQGWASYGSFLVDFCCQRKVSGAVTFPVFH